MLHNFPNYCYQCDAIRCINKQNNLISNIKIEICQKCIIADICDSIIKLVVKDVIKSNKNNIV